MNKWNKNLPIIRDMAGSYSANEIAEAIGTTTNNLYKICHRSNISLPRPESYKKRNIDLSVDLAVSFLVEKGYRVYAPDPFKEAAT